MSDALLLLLPQLRALKAQVEALLFMAEMHAVMLAPQPSDVAQKCPKCGGEGDTQVPGLPHEKAAVGEPLNLISAHP